MAYSDTVGDNAQLLKKTIRGIGDFAGRSRRTEVVYYWIACALVGVAVTFPASLAASFEAYLWFSNALQFLFLIPMFALFARRLHDQDRSGWWAVLLPFAVLLNIPSMIAEATGNFQAIMTQKATPVAIASGLLGIVILILCLWPGTDGPNSYGPDPRLEEI